MIQNPKEAIKKAKTLIRDWKKEHFIGLYLNSRTDLEKIELISLGTVNVGLVHPRETFKPALINSASGVIVMHNHPSGDPEPSEKDIEITKQLTEAGEVLGIDLLDHIIFTEGNKFFSMKEKNLI